MAQDAKPSNAPPVGLAADKESDEVVNDSLGTVDLSDSTGTDPEEAAEDRRPNYVREGGKV
jgi:hypothetical protein